MNYLEHRRQHKDALWEQLREPHQAPHRSIPIKRLTASQIQATFESYIIPEAE